MRSPLLILVGLLVYTVLAAEPPKESREDTRTTNLSYLLRSCLRCHGEAGPNKKLFGPGRVLLAGVPPERLRWGGRIALREAQYRPTDPAELADLYRAVAILSMAIDHKEIP